MGFGDAINSVLRKNYANFSSRARRSEYWYWILFTVLVNIVVRIVSAASSGLGLILSLVVFFGFLVPQIAVATRRLHDTGRSGWWQLLILTIIGIIVLLVWYCQDSKADNKYGPNPKGFGGGGYGIPDAPYPPQYGAPGGYPPPGTYPPPPPSV
jgi:uncharacterized membrane protein YhaH (DUF805 family)